MYKLALIGAGGLLGTLCRYAISVWVDGRSQSSFPYGTLAVNVVGCFAAGFLFQWVEGTTLSPEMRLAIFTGFLGGFTTFSAYGLQTHALTRDGRLTAAALNVLLSNILGLVSVWVGNSASRTLFSR
jgi:CrcB protein